MYGCHAGRQEVTRCRPEVNRSMKNPLHVGDEACKRGIHPGFETQDRRHQKSKEWYHRPTQGLMSYKYISF